MVVRELVAKLGLDFEAQSFLKAEVAFELLKDGAEKIKGAIEGFVDSLVEAVVSTAEEAHHLELLSQEVGISTQALQELGYAGSISGLSMDDMARSLGFLSRNVKRAADGSYEAQRAFQQAGVGSLYMNGQVKSSDELLLEIADKFKGMPNGPIKAGLAMQLFGRAGKQLIPFLNKGRDGIADLREEAESLGIVMGDDTVSAGAELSATFIRIKAFATGLARTFAGPLLKPLVRLGEAFIAWARANREVIKTRIEGWVQTLIGVAEKLAPTVEWLLKNLDIVASVVASVLIPVLYAGAAALFAWALSWIPALVPIALMAAAILFLIGVYDDLKTFMEGGDSLIGRVFGSKKDRDAIYEFMNDIKVFFGWLFSGGFGDAIADTFLKIGDLLHPKGASGLGNNGVSAMVPGGGNDKMGETPTAKQQGLSFWDFGRAPTAPSPSVFGAGGAPSSAPGSTPVAGSTNVAPQVISNMPITINAQSGQDPKAIAQEVLVVVQDHHERMLRDAQEQVP